MTDPLGNVSGVSSTGGTQSTQSSQNGDNSQLSSQAFLQLLVAQLQYQDPTSPVDTSTLMSQTATLNQIQTMEQLSQASTAQTQAQQEQTATNLVGHTVSYTDKTNKTTTGFVSAATISGTTPSLTIGGQTVALSQIQQVLASQAAPTTDPTA
jgi:flagellar basal-body rod modification protein FlgD